MRTTWVRTVVLHIDQVGDQSRSGRAAHPLRWQRDLWARIPSSVRAAEMTDTLWYCYLARCRDSSLYVGITTDLQRRMAEHNAGRGAKYTRSRRPITLVWWECCATQSAALKREAEVRTWRKSRKEAFIANWLHAITDHFS